MTATEVEPLAGPLLEHAASGLALHLDHYGGRVADLAVVRGKGIWTDAVVTSGPRKGDMTRLLDASGAYASTCLGASHPAVREGLIEGLEAGQATDEIGSVARSELLWELLGPDGLLTDHFPYGEYVASGRSSGSEGVELALRLALESRVDMRSGRPGPRAGRNVVLAFEGAWHGWTGGLVPLLNRRHYKHGLPSPETSGISGLRVEHIPFDDTAALREFMQRHGENLLATVVEPIQGDAGILEPADGYLREVAAMTKGAGALLIADEVLTFAKTGQPLAMRDSAGPVPTDVTVIGKSIGMGAAAFSMVIARNTLQLRATGAVSTNDLRPLACSVALHGLRHIAAANLFQASEARGLELKSALDEALVQGYPHLFREVRGKGALLGVELTESAANRVPQLRRSLADRGILVEFMAGAGRRSGDHRYVFPTLRVVPTLNMTEFESMELLRRLVAGVEAFDRSSTD